MDPYENILGTEPVTAQELFLKSEETGTIEKELRQREGGLSSLRFSMGCHYSLQDISSLLNRGTT